MDQLHHEDALNINEIIEKLNVQTNKVEKEKRRMEVFADFQLTEESTGTARLKPRYNVLPLLSKHLKQTQKTKQWIRSNKALEPLSH